MATIVQDYGPIYGEVVNGTVQGRPNGSIYVPLSNTITASIREVSRYIKKKNSTTVTICKSDGTVSSGYDVVRFVANAQDLSSYVRIFVYSDALLTTLVSSRSRAAGYFNGYTAETYFADGMTDIDEGETYYVVAALCNNGVPVATSAGIEVTGV